MALDDREVERTIEAPEKTLSLFSQFEKDFRRMTEEKEALARGLGAQTFSQLAVASQKGMTEEARKKLDEAKQALAKEIEDDASAAEVRFRQEQSTRGSGASRARRMHRMV